MLLLVIGVAGCGSDDAPGVDGVPGDGSLADDAIVNADARDAAPGSLEGDWNIAWTCLDGCSGFPAEPALVYSDRLTMMGTRLHWHDSDCVECQRDHEGVAAGENCLDVPASLEGNHSRGAYQICNAGGAVGATLRWTPRFSTPTPTHWTAAGTRR